MRFRALETAKIGLLLTFAAASGTSGAIDESILEVRDCGVYLEPYSFNSGTILRILERDGLTEERLYARMTELDGTTSPHLYRTRRGLGFVVKEGKSAKKEVAAYQISQRVGLKKMPQTEGFRLGDTFYSAAKEVPTQRVTVVAASGTPRKVKLEKICKNAVPDEMILRDVLIMNADRLPGGHNYILHAKKLPKSVRGSRGRLVLKDVDFIAIDHGSAFIDWKFDLWFMKYQRFVDLKEAEFVAVLRRNPEFVAKLRAWTPAEIRREMRDLLGPDELAALLERRTLLLKTYDRGQIPS